MMDHKVRTLKAIASVIVLIFLAVTISCERYAWVPAVIPEDIIISFSDHIYPACNGCHTSWSSEKIYDELTERVDTLDPESSEILSLHGSIFETEMVQVNDTLTIPLYDAVVLWASQGAKNNK